MLLVFILVNIAFPLIYWRIDMTGRFLAPPRLFRLIYCDKSGILQKMNKTDQEKVQKVKQDAGKDSGEQTEGGKCKPKTQCKLKICFWWGTGTQTRAQHETKMLEMVQPSNAFYVTKGAETFAICSTSIKLTPFMQWGQIPLFFVLQHPTNLECVTEINCFTWSCIFTLICH